MQAVLENPFAGEEEIRMPIGKYKGWKISELPLWYLAWCRGKMTYVDRPVMEAIDREYLGRMY